MIIFITALSVASGIPHDQVILNEATRCGLHSSEILWTLDFNEQQSAVVRLKDDLDEVSTEGLTCFLDWGKRSGLSVGYVSDPPPSSADIAALLAAGRQCGVPEGDLSFHLNGLGGYDIRISRLKPVSEDRIECALARLPADFDMKFGVGPISESVPEN